MAKSHAYVRLRSTVTDLFICFSWSSLSTLLKQLHHQYCFHRVQNPDQWYPEDPSDVLAILILNLSHTCFLDHHGFSDEILPMELGRGQDELVQISRCAVAHLICKWPSTNQGHIWPSTTTVPCTMHNGTTNVTCTMRIARANGT